MRTLWSLPSRGCSHISALPHPTLTLEITVSTQPHFQRSLDIYNPVIHPPKLTQSWHDDYSQKCSNPYISLSSGVKSQFKEITRSKNKWIYLSSSFKQYTAQTLLSPAAHFHKYVNDTSRPLIMGFCFGGYVMVLMSFIKLLPAFQHQFLFMSTLAPFTASASSFMGNCLGGWLSTWKRLRN